MGNFKKMTGHKFHCHQEAIATELNFAWYTPKQTNDDHSNANVPKLIIGEGHNMKNAKVYEAEQTAVKDEQDNNGGNL